MDIPDYLLVHAVTVEPLLGRGPYGAVFDTPSTCACFVDDTRALVRSADGREVVSEARVITKLSQAPVFPTGSRVTLPSGLVAYVITTSRNDDGGLGAPSHLEVTL